MPRQRQGNFAGMQTTTHGRVPWRWPTANLQDKGFSFTQGCQTPSVFPVLKLFFFQLEHVLQTFSCAFSTQQPGVTPRIKLRRLWEHTLFTHQGVAWG